MFRPLIRPSALLGAALAAILATACVDAPYAPDDLAVSGPLVFAPSLALVGPGGAPAASEAQADALSEAFDRVNRFRMVVRRATDNSVVVDTIITVTPGQDQYDLAVSVKPRTADEVFLVTLTALEGDTELFSSPPISLQAVPDNAPPSSTPEPLNVTLEYSGPGATAASVELSPTTLVLGPGGGGSLTATVLDEDGGELASVPVSWSVGNGSVASVATGSVTATGDGVTTVTVTTPTGLEASARVYVVSGLLAYVEDGRVMTRDAAFGTGQPQSTLTGASAPAWSPDGGRLYFVSGGAARRAGTDAAVVAGGWPAVSPDGNYLAVDRGGEIVFANSDGSRERVGPSGTTPVWSSAGTLVVGGGSVEEVDVSGDGRSTLVPGDAGLPALGPGGTLAYVAGGQLRVMGRDGAVAEGALGRPSWSANGRWLAFQGSAGMMVVPADGSAPPVALPGLGGASQPAWQPSSPLGAPAGLSVTGLDPDPPTPGQRVAILGSGFDLVIPGNNQVFWPTPDGPASVPVSAVTAGALTTTVPSRVAQGQIRVTNRTGTALLDFVPSLGALEVVARTSWGAGVPSLTVAVIDAEGTEVASGVTDANGHLLLAGLRTGSYTVNLTPPSGFTTGSATSTEVEIGTEALRLEVVLDPVVARIEASPSAPTLAVGDRVAVSVTAWDANGSPIPEFASSAWGAITSDLEVTGSGTTGVLGAVAPGEAPQSSAYAVRLNGKSFELNATVTSGIGGRITMTTDKGQAPAKFHLVTLKRGSKVVGRTETDGQGRYYFGGLFAGEYVVRPSAPTEGAITPEQEKITLDENHPSGSADFHIAKVAAGPGEVLVFGDINFWGSGTYVLDQNNREMTRNLVTNAGRTHSVWYFGHDAHNNSFYNENYFATTVDYVENTVGHTLDIVKNTTTGGLSIPSDAASIWLWMPQAVFDASDVATIQAYLAGGGRVILIGENSGSSFNTANQRVQELMNALGSAGVYTDGCENGVAADVTDDHLTQDVTAVYTRCSSYVALGAGDTSLIRINGRSLLTRIRLGAPVAPSLRAALVAPPAEVDALHTSGDPSVGPAEGRQRR